MDILRAMINELSGYNNVRRKTTTLKKVPRALLPGVSGFGENCFNFPFVGTKLCIFPESCKFCWKISNF